MLLPTAEIGGFGSKALLLTMGPRRLGSKDVKPGPSSGGWWYTYPSEKYGSQLG